MAVLILIAAAGGAGAAVFSSIQQKNAASEYVETAYNKSFYQGELFAENLCVTDQEVSLDGFEPEVSLHAAGLFDLDQKNVLCGYQLFEHLYPASTTKIMTAYVALKYGNLTDTVSVSDCVNDFGWDEVTCGLLEGDTLTLYDLLCGLLLPSGNDCGTVIAEYISGSEEAFAELMNSEASRLGATDTHFVNPHGLHDESHYTTAYDLYLIFNACVKNETFVEIISMDSYTASITGADGTQRSETWSVTNYYSAGLTEAPEGVRVLGGKTGTTDEAGNCVILYELDGENNPYISVIMGASSKDELYLEMNQLLANGIS